MKYMEAFHNFDHDSPFDRVSAQNAMKAVITNPGIGRVWLIQLADETIGYIVLTLAYRLEYRGYYAFLDELYIREDQRGRGVGTQALNFLKQACQDLKVSLIQLEVKMDNPHANALYQKANFSQQDRTVLIQFLHDSGPKY